MKYTPLLIGFILMLGLVLGISACDMAEQKAGAGLDDSQSTHHDHDQRGQSTNSHWKPVSVKKLYPPKPAQGAFIYTEGPDKGKKVAYTVQDQGGSQGQGQSIFTLKGRLKQYFVHDQQGALRLRQVNNYVKDVRVEFDPPLVALPAKLSPDTHQKQKVKITVKDLDSGSVKDSGTCVATLKGISRQTINTPAGKYKVYMVHLGRKMDMSMANVDLSLENAYASGVGLVSSESTRHTNIVSIIDRDNHHRYERAKGSSGRK